MWDKLEKTFHLMHLSTAVSQLAANKTNKRTSLLCQNDKYKQLLKTDLFFKTKFHCGNGKTFFHNVPKVKFSSEKLFIVRSKNIDNLKIWFDFQHTNW